MLNGRVVPGFVGQTGCGARSRVGQVDLRRANGSNPAIEMRLAPGSAMLMTPVVRCRPVVVYAGSQWPQAGCRFDSVQVFTNVTSWT